MSAIYFSRFWTIFGLFAFFCALSWGQGCLDDPRGLCNEGWSLVSGGNCVIIPKGKANFAKAKGACTRKEGMLVELDNISGSTRACLLGLHPHKKFRMIWVMSNKECKLHDLASTSNRSPGCKKKRFYACQKKATQDKQEVVISTTTEEPIRTATPATTKSSTSTSTTVASTSATTRISTTTTTTTTSTSQTTTTSPTTTTEIPSSTTADETTSDVDLAFQTRFDTMPETSINTITTTDYATQSLPTFETTPTIIKSSDTQSLPELEPTSTIKEYSTESMTQTTKAESVQTDKSTEDNSLESTTHLDNIDYEPKVNIGFTIIGTDDSDQMKTTGKSASDMEDKTSESTTEFKNTETTVTADTVSLRIKVEDSVIQSCQQSPETLKCPQDWIAFNNTICFHINEESTGDHSEATDDCIDKKGELATETDFSEGVFECLRETFNRPEKTLRLAGGKCVNVAKKTLSVCASDLALGHICAIHREPSAGESVQGVDAAPVAGMTLAATSVAIIVYHTLKVRMSS